MAATAKGLSDEKAARMMAALRDGQTLRKFGVVPARLEAYFKANPEYEREARPLIQANNEAARLQKGAHHRIKTHCKNGHPFAVYQRLNLNKGCITRQCRQCERDRIKLGGLVKPEVIVKVRAALDRGLTINAITAGSRPTRLLAHHALSRYRRENPEFDRFVLARTKDSNSRGQKLRYQRARNEAVLDQNNDYYKIRALLPANFPDKDDVVSDIFEALLNGSLRREDVGKRVRDYIRIHNRAFSTQYLAGRPLSSLDAPLFADGTMTVGDTITRGLWD
jgi:hypothetical protein